MVLLSSEWANLFGSLPTKIDAPMIPFVGLIVVMELPRSGPARLGTLP
jgi:hypothetical protein